MYKTILVPLDGSRQSAKALPPAVHLARRTGAIVRLATVLTPDDQYGEWPPGVPRGGQAALDLAADRARQAAPQCLVQTALLEGPVVPALADHARAVRADLIVLTTHDRGAVSRFWFGSVTDELLRRSTVPLLVFRPADDGPAVVGAEVSVRRVVVPLDGSPWAKATFGPAAELARLFGASLELFYAVVPLPMIGPDGLVHSPSAADAALVDELVVRKTRALEAAATLRREGLVVTTHVVIHAAVAAAILEETQPGDVIALATHAPPPATRLLLGSVADKLIRGAGVPVLAVRPDGHPT
jgi:nucleotide-binding universal stress UspA family protein